MNHMWLTLGFIGQGIFASRFLVQWVASEKAKQSVIPVIFWHMSLLGGLLLFIYSLHKKDLVFIVGQGSGIIVYARNLILIRKKQTGAPTPQSVQTQGN